MTLRTPPRSGSVDPLATLIANLNDQIEGIIEHAPGIIQIGHWNPEMEGFYIRDTWDYGVEFRDLTNISSYDVAADSLEDAINSFTIED